MMLNKQSPIPLYMQLKHLLQEQVESGILAPHSRIPSERELSEQYEISRMTARQALTELIQEGRLYTSVGKGTFVAELKISQNLQALTSFSEDMYERGLTPSTQLLGCEMSHASAEVAAKLRIAEGAPVLCLQRLRLADQEPMALETASLSFQGMEQLLQFDLSGSLYRILRQHFGLIPVEAIQEFEAMLATPYERKVLHISGEAAVLKLQRITFDHTQRPFEYVDSIYRGDRYRFVARLTRQGGL